MTDVKELMKFEWEQTPITEITVPDWNDLTEKYKGVL